MVVVYWLRGDKYVGGDVKFEKLVLSGIEMNEDTYIPERHDLTAINQPTYIREGSCQLSDVHWQYYHWFTTIIIERHVVKIYMNYVLYVWRRMICGGANLIHPTHRASRSYY